MNAITVFLYTVGLSFSLWGASTNTGFWQAWCIAWAVANGALLLHEITR